MRAPIVELDRVSFRYAGTDRWAIEAVSLAVDEGELVAVLGRNGAGKTTLALCLAGIVPGMVEGELRGRVRVAGIDPATTAVRDLARSVGIVFDNPEFQMSQLTVAEEVAFGLENLGVPRDEMAPRIAGSLALVGLAGFEARVPMSLSAGEQQRLAIAAVIAMRPRVLVMDEPTSNLDPVGKREVLDLAARLNWDHGLTVVIAEHDVDAVVRHADRVIVLDEGRVVASGAPRAVFAERTLLDDVGVRPPRATELAQRVGSARAGWPDRLPVTVDEAVASLEPRLAAARR